MNNPRKEFYSTIYLLTLVNFMNRPLVSVIIPTYKRRNKLKRAIKSVLNQTYPCIEIIVVNDDPSTDIEDFLNVPEEVIVVNHNENKGPSGARNTGLKIAKGKYIAFLDDDDYFLTNKLEEEVKVMEKLSDEWVAVYSWFISLNQNGTKKVNESYKEGDLTHDLLSMNTSLKIGTPSFLSKSETLKSVGGFDESLYLHEEWDILIRLSEKGGIKLLPKPLWVRRRHDKPQANKILNGKIHYLKKHRDKINQFRKSEKNIIYQNHFLALSYLLLKERGYRKALYYLKMGIENIPPLPKLNSVLKLFLGLFEGLLNKKIRYKFR